MATLLTRENSSAILNSDLILKMFQLEYLVSVYAVNSNYFFLQQSLDVQYFRILKMPLSGLHFIKSGYGTKVIDVKKNPGYSEVVANTWLMPAWKMWLNNDFFLKLLGKDVYDFPFSVDKYNDKKVTYIQLYENQNEPHFKLNKKRQKQFKEWIGFDNLVREDRAI